MTDPACKCFPGFPHSVSCPVGNAELLAIIEDRKDAFGYGAAKKGSMAVDPKCLLGMKEPE